MNLELLINVLVILVVIVVLILLAYKGKMGIVKRIILALVVQAELNWGSGTGKIKLVEVFGLVYERLPVIIKIFITEKQLINLIEEAVEFMKAQLIEDDIVKLSKGE